MSMPAEKAVAILEDAAERERAVVPVAQPSETAAILGMIERLARDPSVDVGRIERMFDLREKALDRASREAFDGAFAQMQPKLPVIAERGRIEIGGGKSGSKVPTYALWEDINEAIKDVLSAHGFALSFRTGHDGDRIVVTGILSHRGGHREETTMRLPIDTGPGRNAVQSVGSSTSYGKRYTAAALLNLTSRLKEDRDDDGQAAAGPALISDLQVSALRAALAFRGRDEAKFCQYAKVGSLADIHASKFDDALRVIETAGAKA